jgi:hypothetical protein
VSSALGQLGVSNGAPQVEPPPLNLPPGHVVSLNSTVDVAEKWEPRPLPSLYILHLDVPAGVVVESRDDFYLLYADVPELFPVPLGKVSIPVFRELGPAGMRQIQLGTDLNANSSRVNVSIYNAGSESANATVEVRRTCDDSVTETRSLTIPPNTVVQTNGMQSGGATCTGVALNSQWTRYTVVTVSQPSAAFVSNVNETVTPPPGADGVVPIVGLAVSHNSKF